MIRKVAKYKQLCVSYTKQWFGLNEITFGIMSLNGAF